MYYFFTKVHKNRCRKGVGLSKAIFLIGLLKWFEKKEKSIIDQFLSPPTGNYIQQSGTNSTGDKKKSLAKFWECRINVFALILLCKIQAWGITPIFRRNKRYLKISRSLTPRLTMEERGPLCSFSLTSRVRGKLLRSWGGFPRFRTGTAEKTSPVTRVGLTTFTSPLLYLAWFLQLP